MTTSPKRLVVGITGSSGVLLGVRLLQLLRPLDTIETHVVISKWGLRTLHLETDFGKEDIERLADHFYPAGDMGAAISSGSFITSGMVVIPCSMRSLAAIASGTGQNLVHRAADVTLKERRQLVLVPRETPLHQIHLQHLLTLARMGVTIMPPMLAFYHRPETVSDLVDQVVMRVLDQLGIHLDITARWNPTESPAPSSANDLDANTAEREP